VESEDVVQNDHALLNTRAWPLFGRSLQEILEELIGPECKVEIAKLTNPEVPV